MKPGGVPDHSRAARLILKDFVQGKLIYCQAPPNVNQVNYTFAPTISMAEFFLNIFLLAYPIWLPVFSLFLNEPELGTEIDSGMVMTPFPSIVLDETRFEPTTYRL
jgi:hypothetical protein